jgi:23S rRNA pseudouridine1911/1915/1917 synthase
LNDRIESWIVPPGGKRVRLDLFLTRQIPGESRSRIQSWIRDGYIRVNGERVKTGYRARPNDHIVLRVPETIPELIGPEDIPLDVLYEDPDLAVINKPAGLVCHAGAGVRSGTLVNALLHRMGPLDTGDPARPGIVHRLDKFTSGVMLVAKNRVSHRRLALQFKNRQVRKEYLALVYGKPVPASGTIDLPLGRDPRNRKKISARARRARSAVTHYSLQRILGPFSLLGIRIETGRTHQIRAHLSQKGHPVVGDTLYGANRIRNLPAAAAGAVRDLGRPFLHSSRLELHHPSTGETLSFQAPLAQELKVFLERIEKWAAGKPPP